MRCHRDLVREVILSKPGLVDTVLDTVRVMANSNDAEVRTQARAVVDQYGLGLLLVEESDDL